MKRLNNLSIKTKLITISAIVVTIIITVISNIITYQVEKVVHNHAITIAEETAHNYANIVTNHLEKALSEAVTMAGIFRAALINPNFSLDRDDANTIMKEFIERNTFLIGASVAFEPNVFDGQDEKFINYDAAHDASGRFVPYWSRDEKGKGVVEPLIDYNISDWYLLPKQRKKPCLIEPYIYPMQQQDILMTTLVAPILGNNDDFLGIFGVDITLNALQDLVQHVKISDLKGAYAAIYSFGGIIIAEKNTHLIGKNIEATNYSPLFLEKFYSALNTKEHFTLETVDDDGKNFVVHGVPIQIGCATERWVITTSIPEDVLLFRAKHITTTISIVGMIGTISIIWILYLLTKKIVLPLRQISQHLKALSLGNPVVENLTYKSNDEIGEIVNSTQKVEAHFRKIIDQVHTISTGNYNLKIKPLSKNDQLSASLIEMTQKLHTVMEQNKLQNWLKTGQTQLNDQMRGEQTPIILAKNIICFLCRYLNAHVGVLYNLHLDKEEIFDESHTIKIRMLASYAYHQRKKVANEFDLGEGIVGQVALEKEMIVITDIPKDYVNIESGLGKLVPTTLVVIPFLHEDKLKGIIELGFLDDISQTKLDFLNQVMPSIAIAIESAQARINQI